MIADLKALASSGYTRIAHGIPERWKRVGVNGIVVLAMVAYGVVVAVVFIWCLRAAPVIVTHDQARTYAGIVAQVIAVLLLALYVESTTTWGQTQAEQRAERMGYLELGRKMESALEAAAVARKHYEAGTTSPEVQLADSVNNDTMSGLQSMLLDHKRRSDGEGNRAVFTVVQLFAGLIGEVFALSAVLAPSRSIISSATIAAVFLLYLFGQRLLQWPRAVSSGRAVRLLSNVGNAVLALSYFAILARISTIHVTG